ncbi:MAG: SusC/RagA family TonB-linked outer membrane protein [Imperialibacter sp.]|uniref:SusC/RagA family TonB-linked outer membrane protein n=1 Tax=Imperialibacter sp. TaxID=2038411 RepID=UPI0032EBAB5F
MNAKLRKLILHVSKFVAYVTIFCYSLTMAFGTETSAQQKLLGEISVDLSYQKTSLIDVIKELESKTDFSFVYSKKELAEKNVLVPEGEWKMDVLMYSISSQANVAIRRVNQQISIKPLKPDAKAPSVEEDIRVRVGVSGKVVDENGESIAGVTIVVKGTSTGTISDASGAYSLEVPEENSVLIFSFIGHVTQEISVGGRSVIDVTMVVDVFSLEEVVVTALGVEKESKKLGYAVTSVNTKDLVDNRTTNVMESLEGRVAGLNITPPAAGAGSSMQVRLRGQAAFAGANNAPLFVINGLPIDQGARGTNGRGENRDLGDNLQNINPDDIESMTVLKGATAAAIYGSRAANGAIIITTKSGRKNQGIGVEYSASYSAMEALNFMDELFQTEYGAGDGGLRPQDKGSAASQGHYGWGEKLDGAPTINFDGVSRPYSAYEDRLFDFLRTGSNWTNTIALSGGGDKGSFRASYSDVDAKGITPNNEYKKRIFNVGLNHDITSKLKMQLNVNYANEENINSPQIGTQGPGAVNFFTRMAISNPLESYKQSAVDPVSGSEYRESGFFGTIVNPYYLLEKGMYFNDDRNRLLGTTTLRYQITDWLYAQGRYNYDQSNNFAEWNEVAGIGDADLLNNDGTYGGGYNIRNTMTRDINSDFLIGGNKEFGVFSVDASVGGNTYRTQWQRTEQNARNFTVPELYTLPNGTLRDQGITPYNYSVSRVNSLYGWTEFGYNGMLYVNFTGRNDWFSVLNPENNSKFYPSVSGSFIFSEVLQSQPWLSYGKLRASWAQVGSANGVNPYDGRLTYSILANQFNGQTLAGVSGQAAPNAALQPFTVTEKELGIEMRLFEGKVLVDLGVFEKITTDQILNVQISEASGFAESKQNKASLKNTGFESLLQGSPIEAGNFKWTSSWNNTVLSTEVLDLGGPESLLLIYFNGTGNEFLGELRYTVGMPMNQLYTRSYLRNDNGDVVLNSANGRLLATNSSTPGAENTNGFLPVGSSMPKLTGGWANTFSYKNLTLGVHIDYKFGGTVLSSTWLNTTRQGHSILSLEGREGGLVYPGVINTGTQENPVYVDNNITVPVSDLRAFYSDYRNLQIGDPFTFKTDFVKLRNISLSYNFTSALSKVGGLDFIKGLTMTAAVRNLAILYKDMPGLDPEAIQSSGDFRAGYENSSLPTTRNYTFSLNVKF